MNVTLPTTNELREALLTKGFEGIQALVARSLLNQGIKKVDADQDLEMPAWDCSGTIMGYSLIEIRELLTWLQQYGFTADTVEEGSMKQRLQAWSFNTSYIIEGLKKDLAKEQDRSIRQQQRMIVMQEKVVELTEANSLNASLYVGEHSVTFEQREEIDALRDQLKERSEQLVAAAVEIDRQGSLFDTDRQKTAKIINECIRRAPSADPLDRSYNKGISDYVWMLQEYKKQCLQPKVIVGGMDPGEGSELPGTIGVYITNEVVLRIEMLFSQIGSVTKPEGYYLRIRSAWGHDDLIPIEVPTAALAVKSWLEEAYSIRRALGTQK